MKDPGLDIQKAVRTAVVTALTNLSVASPSSRVLTDASRAPGLPYVVLGEDTIRPWDTKTNEGAEATHTFVCWSSSETEAKQIADQAIRIITDRDSPITIEGHANVLARLDMRMPPLKELIPDGTTRFGVPVRIRFLTQET